MDLKTTHDTVPTGRSATHTARTGGVVLGVWLYLCQPAHAQTTAAPELAAAAKPGASAAGKGDRKAASTPPASTAVPAEVQVVTVIAERATNRVDRDVYDVKPNETSGNKSAAEALADIPAVTVDKDGTVALRGKTNVQIYIDGKPAARLQGESRASGLASIPSDDIKQIEVINNPGAQFGNEGGGGAIINLVLKRERRAGGTGSVILNGASNGGRSGMVRGSFNEGRYGVEGGVNANRSVNDNQRGSDRRYLNPLTGLWSHSQSEARNRGTAGIQSLNLNGRYNLGDRDTLGVGVNAMRLDASPSIVSRYRQFDQDEVPISDFTRTQNFDRQKHSSNGLVLALEHLGDIDGESMKMDFRVSGTDTGMDLRNANAYVLRPPGSVDILSTEARQLRSRIVDYTGDYERPLESGFLKLGYKMIGTRTESSGRYAILDDIHPEGVLDARRSSRFKGTDATLAAYATYERAINKAWGLLVGLRTEYTHLDVAFLSTGTSADKRYLNFIPSAYATYKMNPTTTLRFQYAHRVQRPRGELLNPYLVYYDEFNAASGNPALKPVQNDRLEAMYLSKLLGYSVDARAYVSVERDSIRARRRYISDAVSVSMPENGGGKREGGLQFGVNGKVTPALTMSLNATFARNESVFVDLRNVETRQVTTGINLQSRFTLKLGDMDSMTVTANRSGKLLDARGAEQAARALVGVNYFRTLNPEWSMNLGVADLTNPGQVRTRLDTAFEQESSYTRTQGRTWSASVNYRFGGFRQVADAKTTKLLRPREAQGGKQ